MSGHKRFNLDDTPTAQGIAAWLSMWATFIGRTTGAMEWTASSSHFHGQLEYMELSHLKIFWASSTPFALRRVSASPCVNFSRGFKVMLQVRGSTTVRQDDRTVDLAPGQWVAYDAGHPYEVINRSDFEQLTLLVPRASLVGRQNLRMAPLFRAHPSGHGLNRIFWDYLKSVVREGELIDLQGERSIASAVESMLMQLLGSACAPAEAQVKLDLNSCIKAWINDHLHDQELSLESLAIALNTTKRSLHRAFEAEDESINDYIWRMRIERCQQVLEQSSANWSVTDLAFAHGFKDSAHFSRRFKQHTGRSPSSYFDPGQH